MHAALPSVCRHKVDGSRYLGFARGVIDLHCGTLPLSMALVLSRHLQRCGAFLSILQLQQHQQLSQHTLLQALQVLHAWVGIQQPPMPHRLRTGQTWGERLQGKRRNACRTTRHHQSHLRQYDHMRVHKLEQWRMSRMCSL